MICVILSERSESKDLPRYEGKDSSTALVSLAPLRMTNLEDSSALRGSAHI